jgi:hypothetical protein
MHSSLRIPTLLAMSLDLCLVACSSTTTMRQTTDGSADDAKPGTERDARATDGRTDSWPGTDARVADALGRDLLPSKDLAPADTALDKDAAGTEGDATAGEDVTRSQDAKSGDDAAIDVAITDGGRDAPSAEAIGRDAMPDLAFGCLIDRPGPGCNDNPNSAAVMGTCQPDGTCKCNEFYVLNPSTGRCMYPPRDSSVGDTDALANLCSGTYNSCACSCCGVVGRDKMCYFPTLGESPATLAAADEERYSTILCASDACSSGVQYLCCTPTAPESSTGASYASTGYSGGLDHLEISKTSTDCATLSFARPATAKAGFHIDVDKQWSAVGGSFGACGDAGAQNSVKGALGSLVFRMSGDACVMDLHATLFAISDSGVVSTTRMDADGIPSPPSWGDYLCH